MSAVINTAESSSTIMKALVRILTKHATSLVIALLSILAMTFFIAAATGHFPLALVSSFGLLGMAFIASIVSAVQRGNEGK